MYFVKKSLRNKLIVVLLTVSLGSIGIVGFLSFSNARNSLQNAGLNALESIADLKTQKIELFFQERRNNIKEAQNYFNIKTNLPTVSRLAGDRTSPEYIAAKKMLDDQLKTFQKVYDYADVMLVNPEGKIVYGTEETHEKSDLDQPLPDPTGKAFKEGKKKIYFSGIFKFSEKVDNYEMLVTAPAYGFDGKFAGVIALEIDMAPIYKLIQDTTGLGKTGETLIGQQIGNAIVFLNPLRHDPDAAFNRKVTIGSDEAIPTQEAARGLDGIDLSVDYRGEKVIARWRHIPSLNWGLVAKIDREEAFAPVVSLRNYIAVVSILLTFLLVGLAFWISKKLIDPLKSLNKLTDRISLGDFSVYPEIKTVDEVGQLSNAFIQMSRKLEKSITSLKGEISERKQAEEALKESERRLSEAQRIAHIGNWELNLITNKFFCSDEVYRLFGLKQFGPSYEAFLDIIHPDDRDLVNKAYTDSLKNKTPYQIVHRLLLKDKTVKYVNEMCETYYDDSGKPIRSVGTVQDITERKKDEERLKESEEKYRTSFEGSRDAINIFSKDKKILDVNERLVKLSGYSKEELLSMTIDDLYPEAKKDDSKDRIKALLQGEEIPIFETYLVSKREENIPVEIGISVLEKAYGGNFALQSIVRDITGHKQLEAQLFQSQKIEAIGTLAGGIAHDFNNALSPIIGFTELAINEFPDEIVAKDYLGEVLTAARRAENLVRQILAFSRKDEQVKKPLRIQPIIKEALKLLRSSIPTTIAFNENIEDECGPILCDSTQIHQIMMNLCTNAVQAMGDTGGVLDVKLTRVDLDSRFATLHQSISPGPHVLLTVRDTGQGMPREIIEKIFDPFFTTKDIGNGTGMGLAVVNGIVEGHGGAITAHSEIGKGSTFHVYFPLVEEKEETEEEIEALVPTGNECILCIDDEQSVIKLIKQMLEQLGYKVEARTSSMEALEFFHEGPDRFDLVITDMTMPDMTGDQLAKKMMKIRPDIPIILCTGSSERISEEKAEKMGIQAFLMKPFKMRSLGDTVRTVLDRTNAD